MHIVGIYQLYGTMIYVYCCNFSSMWLFFIMLNVLLNRIFELAFGFNIW